MLEADYHNLNAELNLYGDDGKIQFGKDKEAARQYFLQHVNRKTMFFHSLSEKLDYLFDNDYYEKEVYDQYSFEFVKSLFKRAYGYKFRFKAFLGAYKFYASYALKTFDGKNYLERYEDRICTTALYLAHGDEALAESLVDEMISGRYQPATPTFNNAGKKQRGELVSCFPAGTPVACENGEYKAIESLEVGDLVVTHTGSLNKITKTITNPNTENMITLKPANSPSVTMTANHPVLVYTEEGDERESIIDSEIPAEGFKWVKAEDVAVRSDYILTVAPELYTPENVNYDGENVKKVDSGVLSLIVGKEVSEPISTVYNLEVENDHTYMVNSMIVHNCFLLSTEDSMESIARNITNALQLSKRGGGVAINLTNLREFGAPIKKVENQSSGVVPVMKMLEDSFSYANQLGQRQGAGAVYLNVHHPDILRFLDTKRENADEKSRIKTLSVGVIIPDITFSLAQKNEDMYLFSPYDIERVYGKSFAEINVSDEYYSLVNNPEITKTKINARKLFSTIAELQFESGYPYIMFEDTVNKENPIDGKVQMSNLCVTGDTRLLTSEGYKTVVDLYRSQEDITVQADNRAIHFDSRKKYLTLEKSTKMFKTATNADVFELSTFEGFSLKATEWHKMYVERDGEIVKIPLRDVIVGDRLLVDSDSGYATVSSIDFYGVEDVYDVTVDNGNSVIFNGIVTGNCSEILQVSEPSKFRESGAYQEIGKDISCNLGSMNVARMMESPNFEKSVEDAIRALTAVSDLSNISSVPSIDKGNKKSHAIGLGQMNLAGFFGSKKMHYGDEESLDFTNIYFYTVLFYALKASNTIARERGVSFDGFEKSQYASGEFFDKHINNPQTPQTPKVKRLMKNVVHIPTSEDWVKLKKSVMKHGLYNQNLQAVPPTGSISYINHSTASIHPITSRIEARKEGKIGRVYYPAPEMTQSNLEYFEDAYDIGYEKLIDVYAVATQYVDQGLSCTLFFKESATTRDLNRAYIYAWKKGLKTLYYSRIRQDALEGTGSELCVSCSL